VKAREALLSALDGAPTAADDLLATAADLRSLAELGFTLETTTREYALFGGFVECAARLASWTASVRACEQDADRFLRGAKVFLRDTISAYPLEPHEPWQTCKTLIEQATDVDDVTGVFQSLLSIPLPVAYALEPKTRRGSGSRETKSEPEKVVVAFTAFSVNGMAFSKDQLLNLNIGYDLEVEVGLSSWPQGESELLLEPLSVEPSDSYDLPTFSFTKLPSKNPLSLKASHRMVVKRANSFLARPMEFTYRARFSSLREITTEGQRHLSVRCFDPQKDPVSGYNQVDHKLVEVRDAARRLVGINDNDLNNLLILMGAVGNIAGQSMQDNLFKGAWTEDAFQAEMRRLLRSYPTIGSELEEHPHVSGGITDLSFRHTRLELKFIDDHYVTRDDVLLHLPQTIQYIAGSDRRFGVLCILDASPKQGAPGSVGDDVSYEVSLGPSGRGLPIGVGTIIVRGNLSRPSTLRPQRKTTLSKQSKENTVTQSSPTSIF
jgi:hypothetical protein